MSKFFSFPQSKEGQYHTFTLSEHGSIPSFKKFTCLAVIEF